MQILCITKQLQIFSRKKTRLRIVSAKQIDKKTLVYAHQTLQKQTDFSRGKHIAEPQRRESGLHFSAESTFKRWSLLLRQKNNA